MNSAVTQIVFVGIIESCQGEKESLPKCQQYREKVLFMRFVNGSAICKASINWRLVYTSTSSERACVGTNTSWYAL